MAWLHMFTVDDATPTPNRKNRIKKNKNKKNRDQNSEQIK